jgi:hypothetical protein
MSTLHVKQIRTYLEENYNKYIDITDLKDKPKQEQDNAFLTRALAAYAIVSVTNINEQDIGPYITCGYGDNGIDAIYYDETKQTLYLVQSKWHHEGSGTIEKGDALKFIKGVKDLIEENYGNFNEKVNRLSTYISSAIRKAQTKIRLIICHTGNQVISDEILQDFVDFMEEINDSTDILSLLTLNQEKIHKSIATNTSTIEINENIALLNWGPINEPYSSYYGVIAAEDVANWYKKYGTFLFSPNIRLFLGTTDVNTELENTILSNPENFVYYNNGITLLCDKVKKAAVGGSKRDSGVFECNNMAVINGAQTVGTIGRTYEKHPENIRNVSLFIRIISLEGSPAGFSTSVTKATNTQNRIDARDFVSQDEENERIKRELLINKINYSYKRGDAIENTETGFDFEEGIIALACANGNIDYAIAAKRYVSSLWHDISKAPYRALINKALVGIKYWRIVQTFRYIEKYITDYRKEFTGRKSMYLVHGNRIIEYLAFMKLNSLVSEKDFSEKPISEIDDLIKNNILSIIEFLYAVGEKEYPDAMLAFLFKNSKKCKKIADIVISQFNPPPPA